MKDKICGIYMIANQVNGKVYVGQSSDIFHRWAEHKNTLRGNCHANNHLQHAWNKYEEQNFCFSIIEECDESELNCREIYWITKKDSYVNGYNLTDGGGGVRGFKHADDTKQKISKTLKEILSDPTNTKWREKYKSEDVKAKIGQASKERLANPENHPMYGKSQSEEVKQKISAANTGRKKTDEEIRRLSERFSGEGNPMFGVRMYGEDNPNFGNHKLSGANNPNCKAVYCPELDEVFWGAKEAHDKYGFSRTGITECCNGYQKTCGKHPITGEKLRWVYNDERYNLQEFVDRRVKSVYCIELNEHFCSASEAGRKYCINISSISECCLRHRKSAGHHPKTGEKLHWVYADEMNNSSVA